MMEKRAIIEEGITPEIEDDKDNEKLEDHFTKSASDKVEKNLSEESDARKEK